MAELFSTDVIAIQTQNPLTNQLKTNGVFNL